MAKRASRAKRNPENPIIPQILILTSRMPYHQLAMLITNNMNASAAAETAASVGA